MNVIAWLEIERAYYHVAIQAFRNLFTGIPKYVSLEILQV